MYGESIYFGPERPTFFLSYKITTCIGQVSISQPYSTTGNRKWEKLPIEHILKGQDT